MAVLGDGELGLEVRLLELGARTVHLYDPDPERVARIADEVPRGVSARMLRDDFDVRDGAFDLVVVPDLGLLPDAAGAIVRLRRVLDPRGAVIAMGRARTAAGDATVFPELAASTIEYAELYDLFALQFENVTMTGVLPFRGVVFAELGAGDDLTVSVDTRLVEPEPPGVFVVVASRDEEPVLDAYAIVQIDPQDEEAGFATQQVDVIPASVANRANEDALEAAAAFAAMQLKAEILEQQLDDHRERLASGEQRAAELESVLSAAQVAITTLERRLIAADQAILDRDDRIAALDAENDERASAGEDALTTVYLEPAELADLVQRAERAEYALAHIADAHGAETTNVEAMLRERAGVIAAMQKELDRREHLVHELVAALEEARASTGAPLEFEAAPAMPGVAPEEVARLRRKMDELALEVARREAELAAQAWRITELENDKHRLAAKVAAPAPVAAPPPRAQDRDLAAARDELDALRQALTQEHAARLAAESGEELTRARAEL
ncbi:MAG TPA: hypothetical protein VLT33_02355, partial [Labilithrix sp.]|nr:hypothetical protein [Labilithrix sp.]